MRLAFAALFFALAASPVAAQGFAGPGEAFAETTLLDGGGTGEGRLAAVHIALADGWKTYWRAPGESGLPPVFDWSGSENLASAEVVFPVPHRFETYGLATWGYKNAVTLPVKVTPIDPTKPVSLKLEMFYGVCKDVCAPMQAALAVDLPGGEAAQPLVSAALEAAPVDGGANGLRVTRVAVLGEGETREAVIDIETANPAAYLGGAGLIEGPADVAFGDGQIERTPQGLQLRAPATVYDPAALKDAALRLTLIAPDGETAADLPATCAAAC